MGQVLELGFLFAFSRWPPQILFGSKWGINEMLVQNSFFGLARTGLGLFGLFYGSQTVIIGCFLKCPSELKALVVLNSLGILLDPGIKGDSSFL